MTNRGLSTTIIVVGVVAPFLGAGYAIGLLWQRLVTWHDLAILGGMYFFTGIGITIGYHRMLTHRSFQAHPAVRCLLLVLGSMAVEGPAVDWAAIHIKHHANADRQDDPHSPLDGFFHAHIGWFIGGFTAEPAIYGKWLLDDRMVMIISKTFLVWAALGFAIPYLLGGWQGVLWGGLVRIFLAHHVTWSVNSVCHTFGTRAFDTPDRSRNNWLVGLLAFGEGWHNNHHAFPRSAFHGLRWWQFDLSAYIIRGLERLGLARDVQRISPAQMQARSRTTSAAHGHR